MATYHLFDVMDHIMGIINDNVFFADISETLYDDDPTSASLSFSAIDPNDEFCEIDYESVESITDYASSSISGKVCYGLTLEELATVHHALVNALQHFKECSRDKSLSKDEVDELKSSSIELRNLQAKIEKFMNTLNGVIP